MIYGSHFSTCTYVSLLIPSIQSPNQSSFSSSSYDPIVAFTGLLINPSHQHIHPSQVHDISHFCGHFLNITLMPWNNPASTRIAQTTTTVFMPVLLIKATSISCGNGLTDLRIPTTDVNTHKHTKLPRVRKREMSKSGDLKGSQKYVWYRICLTLLISSSSHHPRRQQQAAGGDVLMLVPPEHGGSGATMMTDQETLVAPLNPTAIAQLPACSSL